MDIENWYLICVRSIEGHIAPQHTVNYVCAIDFSTFEYAAEKTAASAAESRQVGPLEDKFGGILNPKQGLDVNS